MNISVILVLIVVITEIRSTMVLLGKPVTTQMSKPQLFTGRNVTIASNSTQETNKSNKNSKYAHRYIDNPRNKKPRSINPINKMDRTIIGAIVIGSIFLFITLSITVTVVIFCLKKNTVFVFQKSEQEDINDCTYDDCVDSISCQSSLHYFDKPYSSHHSIKSGCRNHYGRPCVNDFLEQCPVELFYPMHYDKPCPTQFNQLRQHSQRKCRCYHVKHQIPHEPCSSNHPTNDSISETTVWNKLNDGSQHRPLFTTNKSTIIEPYNVDDVKITLDFIANRRVVTTNQTERANIDDKPLLQEFSTLSPNQQGDTSSQLILTPLGKSQTYTDLNCSRVDIKNPVGNSQLCASKKLTKSFSNYDTKIHNNRKY